MVEEKLSIEDLELLSKRIQKTGGCKNTLDVNYLFKHLILEKDEYVRYKDVLPELASEIEVDFISIKKNGCIDYVHLTNIFNKIEIENRGLIAPLSGFVGDLGYGIYVVDPRNYVAINNLKDYIMNEREDNILLVFGNHCGDYLECVYGKGHEGYINIPEVTIEINYTIEIRMEDFLLDY